MMQKVDQHVIAVIPARGGSKGIPRKNLLPLLGHPLLAWSIFAAQAAHCVSRVFVTTDDDEIAQVALDYGAEVIIRPAELSHDTASSEVALLHALEHIQRDLGLAPELLVFLQPTSPIRFGEDIDGAVSRLVSEESDSCFTACPEHFTGRWTRDAEGSYLPENFEPGARPMRQQYAIQYLENGSIYVMKTHVLRDLHSRMGGRITVHPVNALKSLQLDELSEVPLIEASMAALSMRPPLSNALARLRRIKLLVLDFDGVFTDNYVYVGDDGRESVRCSRADSLGLAQLRSSELELMVLSTETSSVVQQRCHKLGLTCISGSADKLSTLRQVLQEQGYEADEVAYMGNDLNDMQCIAFAGLAIAPADAHPEILRHADLVTPQRGGQGAIRQVADWYLDATPGVGAWYGK